MIKISLSSADITEILDNIGSSLKINTTDEFIQFMQTGIDNKTLAGRDFSIISETIVGIAEKQGVDIPLNRLYNIKEKRMASVNSFERLKMLLTDGLLDENETIPKSDEKEVTPPPTPNVEYSKPIVEETPEVNEDCKFEIPDIDHIDYLYKNDIIRIGTINDMNLDACEMEYVPNQDISFEDNFIIAGVDTSKYTTKVVAIANSDDNVVAVGKFINGIEGLHIVCDKKNIAKDWGNNIHFKVLIFPKVLEDYIFGKTTDINVKVTTLKCDIRKKEIKTFNNPLCIDFGTSNTTVGTYGIYNDKHAISLVKFRDVTQTDECYLEIYPTVVYVQDCSNLNDIKYLFGFEANKKIKECNYNPTATVFYEIKRWITSENQYEEIIDESEEGHCTKVKRIDIIKAYLKHIVDISEHYFKCKFKQIHFTAPVKLKDRFYQIVNECFKYDDYEIIPPSYSLDEGMATIYESIRNSLDVMNERNIDNMERECSIMVLDCGGGTTDVASCKYYIQRDENNGFRHLYIDTFFESGDSNFGGNNVTYRIMQLLKIKMAHSYKQSMNIQLKNSQKITTRINELINFKDVEILELIDNGHFEDIYKKLEEEYEKAEEIIPTRFDYEVRMFKNKRNALKRNFHYLWQLAEKIKIEFYKRNDLLSIGFTNIDDEFRENILKKEDTNFYLYINNNDNFFQSNDIPDIEINTKEIDTLIYGDIYNLVHNVFSRSNYNNNGITAYDYYKLSGQSCKIRLFNTLLKEFIPGNKLRNTLVNYNQTSVSSELKKGCINGAIRYIHDMKTGNIKPKINFNFNNSKLIYQLSRNNGNNFEPIMYIDDNNNPICKVSVLPDTAEYTEVRISEIYNNNSKDVTKSIPLKLNIDIKESYTFKELKRILNENSFVDDDVIEDIHNQLINIEAGNNKCYFALPSKDCFSFYNYVIQKEIKNGNEVYNLINYSTSSFESNLSMTTFFDGKR